MGSDLFISYPDSSYGHLMIDPVEDSLLKISGGYIPPKPPRNAPILYRPLDTSIIEDLDTSLAWYGVSDASSYWLQVDDSTAFSSLLYDVSGITNLYYNLSSLNNDDTYYWRVAGVNQYGVGPWSDIWEFTTPASSMPFISYGSPDGNAEYTLNVGDTWNIPSFSPYTCNTLLVSGQSLGQNRNYGIWRDLEHILLVGIDSADTYAVVISSSDGGQNWSSAVKVSGNVNTYYPYFVPDDGSVRICGWGQGAISRDFGASWTDITLPSGWNPVNFVSSDDGQYVYAGGSGVAYVYNSSDYGSNFVVGIDSLGQHMYATCDETGQYAGAGYGAYSNQVVFTKDYGSTWSVLGGQGRMHINHDATRMIFSNESSTGVFYVSTNYGTSWYPVASQFDSSTIVGVTFQETLDGSIYLHKSDQRKFGRLNGSATGFEMFTLDNSMFAFAVSAFGRGIVYGTQPTYTPYKIFYSNDYENFSSWTEIWTSNTKHPRYLTCQ